MIFFFLLPSIILRGQGCSFLGKAPTYARPCQTCSAFLVFVLRAETAHALMGNRGTDGAGALLLPAAEVMVSMLVII